MGQKKQVDIDNAHVVKRGNYSSVLSKIISEGMCPFCSNNLLKHHTKPILFTTKHWIATHNAWPYVGARKHFLLIAKKHVEKAEDAQPEVWKDLGSVYRKLCKNYKLMGAALVMRSGNTKITGASVRHLHAQVVMGSPRTSQSKNITALVGFYSEK